MKHHGFPVADGVGLDGFAPGVLFSCPGCALTVSVGIDADGDRCLLHPDNGCRVLAGVVRGAIKRLPLEVAEAFIAEAVALPSNVDAVAASEEVKAAKAAALEAEALDAPAP